jgi:hypothetical protein
MVFNGSSTCTISSFCYQKQDTSTRYGKEEEKKTTMDINSNVIYLVEM